MPNYGMSYNAQGPNDNRSPKPTPTGKGKKSVEPREVQNTASLQNTAPGHSSVKPPVKFPSK